MGLPARAVRIASLERTARLKTLGSVLARVQAGAVTQGQAPAMLVTKSVQDTTGAEVFLATCCPTRCGHARASPLSLHVGN
jgi:hypothetical protein